MKIRRSRWLLSVALAATCTSSSFASCPSTSIPFYPDRGCFFHDADWDLPPSFVDLPIKPKAECPIRPEFIAEQANWVWQGSKDFVGAQIRHWNQTLDSLGQSISSISDIPTSKPFDERCSLGFTNEPFEACGLVDPASVVELSEDRFAAFPDEASPPTPPISPTDDDLPPMDAYSGRTVADEYSAYDLSVRDQMWLKGFVPGRSPSSLPIFGDGRSDEVVATETGSAAVETIEELASRFDEDDCWRAYLAEEAQRMWGAMNQQLDTVKPYASFGARSIGQCSLALANRLPIASKWIGQSLAQLEWSSDIESDQMIVEADVYSLADGRSIAIPRNEWLEQLSPEASPEDLVVDEVATEKWIRSFKIGAARKLAGGLKAMGQWMLGIADQVAMIEKTEVAAMEKSRR